MGLLFNTLHKSVTNSEYLRFMRIKNTFRSWSGALANNMAKRKCKIYQIWKKPEWGICCLKLFLSERNWLSWNFSPALIYHLQKGWDGLSTYHNHLNLALSSNWNGRNSRKWWWLVNFVCINSDSRNISGNFKLTIL